MTSITMHLTRGATYHAMTADRSIRGEYLGIETPHGDWAVLLKADDGIESIAVASLISIDPVV